MDRTRKHELLDIVVIAVAAAVCGADDWVSVEEFGLAKEDWFRSFLPLPNGIPSHDTFGRVFAALSMERFQECFGAFVAAAAARAGGDSIAVDGKTIRRSHDRGAGKAAIHMVSAWATGHGVLLGQVKTEEKSNEITAIPELLRALDLKDRTVTIDAMGAQKAIAEQIVEQGGNYVLGLKGNQSTLHESARRLWEEADARNYRIGSWDYCETRDEQHGRTEIRRYWTTDSLDRMKATELWPGLKTVVMVETERTLEIEGTTSVEHRLYISSLPSDAELHARVIRAHWSIENSLHWVLDVAFNEDNSRVRLGHGAENMSILRRIALTLLREEKSKKLGVKNKRLAAGWNHSYLAKVLQSMV